MCVVCDCGQRAAQTWSFRHGCTCLSHWLRRVLGRDFGRQVPWRFSDPSFFQASCWIIFWPEALWPDVSALHMSGRPRGRSCLVAGGRVTVGAGRARFHRCRLYSHGAGVSLGILHPVVPSPLPGKHRDGNLRLGPAQLHAAPRRTAGQARGFHGAHPLARVWPEGRTPVWEPSKQRCDRAREECEQGTLVCFFLRM